MRVGLASLAVVARGSWLSPAELEAREDLCAELAEWSEQHAEKIIQKNQDERICVWMFLRENFENGKLIRKISPKEKLPEGLRIRNGYPVPTNSEAAKVLLNVLALKQVSLKISTKDSYWSARQYIEARMLGEHRGMPVPGKMRIVEGLIQAANGSRAQRALEDLDKEYESVAALLETEPRFSYCMNIPCAMVDLSLIHI